METLVGRRTRAYMRNDMKRLLLLALAAFAAAPAQAAPTGVQVGGWARPTVAGQSSGAAYLVIRNFGPGADRVISVSTPAASMVGVHRSTLVGGVARMRPVGPLVIPPGKMLTMGPGGLHVMLMGLKGPLRSGATLPLTIRFEHGGERRLNLPIRMTAP